MIQQVRSALWTILALCFIQLLAVTVSAQEGSPTQKAGTAPAGQKHSDPAIHATASIPFDFWIGPEKMPAGQYVLEMIVPSVGVIRSADGKVEQELYTLDTGDPVEEADSRLIFVMQNDKPVLSEIWSIHGKRRLTSRDNDPPEGNAQTKVVALLYR